MTKTEFAKKFLEDQKQKKINNLRILKSYECDAIDKSKRYGVKK